MGILCSKLRKKSSESLSTTTASSSPHSNQSSLARSLSVTSITTLTPSFTVPTVTKNPHFPLFQLTSVAIHEVLKSMEIIELIQLASVSHKTREIVKSYIKRNTYKLEVFFDHYNKMTLSCGRNKPYTINFENAGNMHLFDVESSKTLLKFDEDTVYACVSPNEKIITTFWKEEKTGVKSLLLYFYKTFNAVLSLRYCMNNELFMTDILKMIKKQKLELDEVRLTDNFTRPILQRMIQEMPIIRKITICSSHCYEFLLSARQRKFTEIAIDEAYWVTNLEVFLNFKSIVLKDVKLEGRDYQKFLGKWMNSDSQLEYANITQHVSQKPHLESIVKGLSAKPLETAFIDKQLHQFEEGECFGIQRKNGDKAIICCLDYNIIFQRTTSFNVF